MAKESSVKDRLRKLLTDFGGQRRKAAEYILGRPGEVAVYSLRKVAARARVSPGTLVTLAKSAGYSSYNAFRARFQQEEVGVLDYFSSGARELQDTGKSVGRAASLIEKVVRSDLKNLSVVLEAKHLRSISEAASAIHNAANVYVIGRRATLGVMHHFYYSAQMIRDGMHFLDGSGDMSADRLCRIAGGDVVVCCGFYPYIRSVKELVDEAETRGAATVCITDSPSSPLARKDGVLITLPVESPWIFGSITAAMVVVQALVAQLTALGGEAVLARLKERERLLSSFDTYVV